MKKYRVYQVDAFTKNLFEGNPAGVVANADGLSDAQMRALARELNNAETAFLLPPIDRSHEVWIRFFTPTTEVPSCGHATISAHYVRALEKQLDNCTVMQRIGIGTLPVDIEKGTDGYRITMTQGDVFISDPLDSETQNALLVYLGISRAGLDERCPIKITSTGHSKVMLGLKSRELLDGLKPDLNGLAKLSEQIGCNGYFVFCLNSPDPGILSHGRMFAPAIGIPEDPVTGNGNGPLGAYLVHHKLLKAPNGPVSYWGRQGEAMGRPGEVRVTVESENGKAAKVQVGGDAVIAFQTTVSI